MKIIVVDDSSSDGTFEAAKPFADVVVSKKREGQSKGLLYGMRLAKFPKIVTIDADLENNPDFIPLLADRLDEFDLVVASRTVVPRFSERLASQNSGQNVWGVRFFLELPSLQKRTPSIIQLKGRRNIRRRITRYRKKTPS